MITKEELLAAIAVNPDLCELGYELAELDRRGYCLWVIDCARHLLPLAQRHLTDSEMSSLIDALTCGQRFLDGNVDLAAITKSVDVPRSIAISYCNSHGEMPLYLAEALEAIANSIELTLPNSKVYHEDIIYAAARAAFDGELHSQAPADMLDESNCNDQGELEGTGESDEEIRWQLNALQSRVLEIGT